MLSLCQQGNSTAPLEGLRAGGFSLFVQFAGLLSECFQLLGDETELRHLYKTQADPDSVSVDERTSLSLGKSGRRSVRDGFRATTPNRFYKVIFGVIWVLFGS